MENKDKRILLISHNPLSQVNNNGKTLVSIFNGILKENIYQIYLNLSTPDYSEECHYLQINEKQIISSFLKAKNLCCQEVQATPDTVSSTVINIKNFAIHTKRILREGIWKIPLWKPKLKAWLADKHFDVVFFMAGDGIFAYDVYRFVMNNISAKSCMFFTDDYIIGRVSKSPIAYIRQCMLKKKIIKTLPIVTEVYVISDEMKDAYKALFGVDSYVIRNFSVEKKELDDQKQNKRQNECLTMVYAGGLHYDRWKVLAEIAKILKEINCSGEHKCCLKIYSAQKISSEIVEKLNVEGASEFCGAVSATQIADVYALSDILIHVESFNKKAIASTKYSFSTKIPEYLSAGKCIFAVGPAEVASLRYLSNCACTVNSYAQLPDVLKKLIYNASYRNLIELNCQKYYENDFSPKNQKKCLEHILRIG